MPAQRKSYPACGRLVVLESLAATSTAKDLLDALNGQSNFTVISFPAMPDSIDLARQAEYQVTSPPGFPDGIHIYKGTRPLKIPMSFKLSSYDSEYCTNGAQTLLQIAATLHALTLPIGPVNQPGVWTTTAPSPDKTTTIPTTPKDDSQTRIGSSQDTIPYYVPIVNLLPPPTCYLELILTEDPLTGGNNVGIACIGYVEEVKVRLLGPYLKGPGVSQNLPSGGEFEFIFVHHPNHGNAINVSTFGKTSVQEVQAYAQVVNNRFYNTINLLTSTTGFAGLNAVVQPNPPPPPAPNPPPPTSPPPPPNSILQNPTLFQSIF